MQNLRLPGVLLFLAGSIALMGIITAEALYPSGAGYTTFNSEISDLGATKPPNRLIYQPSSGVFNIAMLLSGLMTLTATFFQHKLFKKIAVSIPLSLFGLGLIGIGIFSGDKVPYHGMFAMLIFETVKLFRTQNSPARRFSHCQYSMEVLLCQSFV